MYNYGNGLTAETIYNNRSLSMKVVAINGSPRKGGNTEIMIRKVFETLEKAGTTTIIIAVTTRTIITRTIIGYAKAWRIFLFKLYSFSIYSANCPSTKSNSPEVSPALSILTKNAEKIFGCLEKAS